MALLTSASKLLIAQALVRISAGMVGILLNSCCREKSNDLPLSLRFVVRIDDENSNAHDVAESEQLAGETMLRL